MKLKWLLFTVATVAIWLVGLFAFGVNAMSECFPEFPDFENCIAAKKRDAIIIVAVTIGLWLGSAFLIFRKRSTK